MKYTAAHWGSYQFDPGDTELTPLDGDPAPSRIGRGWVSAVRNRDARVMAPVARRGWLAGDRGAARCDDTFVEIGWDRALDLAASELDRVRQTHGNSAIFGGSYGWSSAGRFHHAQSQMRRMLSVAGGFTSSRETYSHAAAEVLFPHVLGLTHRAFQDQVTAMPLVTEHCDVMLAFGGLSARTAQITAAGTSTHEVAPWIHALKSAGVRVVTISPERGEAQEDWLAIKPGTDTALILALIHEILRLGREDRGFLERYTSGWPTLERYVRGDSDGIPKTVAWAAQICDLDAGDIADLAEELTRKRVMVSLAWGLQRADHGEQPIWAGLALACVLGQIGQPGTGYAFGYGSTTPVGRAARLIPWPSLPKAPNQVTDFIPVARIADCLLQPGQPYRYDGQTRHYPDLRLIWWTGGNPFHHHQDLFRLQQAWCRPETVIVNEHSWTATARRADLVLPATTPLERDDIMMNRRDPILLFMSRMFDPMGDARDDHTIFADVAERLGLRDAFTEGRSTDGWLRHIWARAESVAKAHGFALPEFDTFRTEGRFDVPHATERRVAFSQFIAAPDAHGLSTESGKLTLFNRTIAHMDLADCPGHPVWLAPIEGGALDSGTFHLITGQPDTRLHAQNDMGSEAQATKRQGREVCTLHPDAAAMLKLTEGDLIKLSNARGACLCAFRTSPDMRADCISLPTGAWLDVQDVDGTLMDVHGNPNVLTIDKGCSGLSQGNIAHTSVVRAERWTGPLPALRVTRPPVIAS
ncbi:molybdopterin-dependent oxidoreductase [uncultured Roseobacter sp.]|uniref:molybdopterin-dependent oxidoreductase n=1 Tax=uncultured Roseobacter sp. TaxID=114847 RepID=UPI0026362E24|nr:molybdopterin-dependent oxidoreductase [uncultured Roseobacter sp.]